MNSYRLMTCLMMVFLVGCASTETVNEAGGRPLRRVYEAPYATVVDCTVATSRREDLQLHIVENDASAGRIVLSRGITWQSLGEVSIKPVTPTTTAVEMASTGVMAHLTDLPDWQSVLLDQIEQELQRRK